jgi:serine phosphatase RsbU (regulator of sigma subunit)
MSDSTNDAAAGPPLLVTVRLPDGETFERLLERGPQVVGRSPRADLQIRDSLLSREHARLLQDGRGWQVEDLGSHNGTFLNGSRIGHPARLLPGDVLSLGGTQMAVGGAGPAPDGRGLTGTFFRPASQLLDRRLDGQEAKDADKLRAQVARMRVLLDVHQALSRPITLDQLLKPAEAAIYMKRGNGAAACAASRSREGGRRSPFFSTHLFGEVAEKAMAAYVPDVSSDARFADAQSIIGAGVRTMLAAPLLDVQGSLGMMVLVSGAGTRGFTEEDLELLVPLASAAALRIRNVALNEEAVERRRLADQMALAREIQQGLLPERLPELEGWVLHAVNRPSDVVSGDFYSAQLRGEPPELALMIADVAGKGVTASLLTASLEALCAGPLEAGLEPGEVFARVSAQLLRRTPPERYATALLVVLDPSTGRLRFASAGHLPALVVERGGGHRRLRARGFPLGLVPDSEYEQGEDLLAPGETLVLFTDGFTEACNQAEEELGEACLVEVCARSAESPLAEVVARIEEKVAAFTAGAPLSDDRTLVLLRRLP